ncbi:unknown [Phocaeicola dorei CAG:222]|nr:unknown [Phocaeicola dorei CAG:222]
MPINCTKTERKTYFCPLKSTKNGYKDEIQDPEGVPFKSTVSHSKRAFTVGKTANDYFLSVFICPCYRTGDKSLRIFRPSKNVGIGPELRLYGYHPAADPRLQDRPDFPAACILRHDGSHPTVYLQ